MTGKKEEIDSAGDELVNALYDFYQIERGRPTELAAIFGESRQQVQNMRNRKERNLAYKIMMDLMERVKQHDTYQQ